MGNMENVIQVPTEVRVHEQRTKMMSQWTCQALRKFHLCYLFLGFVSQFVIFSTPTHKKRV
jgi:hypothetical protein